MENKDDFMYRWNDSDENNLFIYKLIFLNGINVTWDFSRI